MNIPTYPARPVNGGPLPRARPKIGRWIYEPKINEERVLLNRETGEMFNRQGEPFSKAPLFDTARNMLEDCVNDPALEWLDCGAFGYRHGLGRGSLIIFDAPLAPGDYDARQARIYDGIVATGAGEAWGHEQFPPPPNKVLTFAYCYTDEDGDPALKPLAAWERLQAVNAALGHQLFEGLVAKRRNASYPINTLHADSYAPGWMKHRFDQ